MHECYFTTSFFAAVIHENSIILTGGWYACATRKVWRYTLGEEKLEEVMSMHMKRYNHGAAVAGNFVAVFGG